MFETTIQHPKRKNEKKRTTKFREGLTLAVPDCQVVRCGIQRHNIKT